MKTYRHNVVVHWGDTDPAKIVFYPNYFVWFDQSTRLLFDSAGLDWNVLMATHGLVGMPIVDAHAKFIAPSMFGDEIVVESKVAEWRGKTFLVSHTIYNRGEVTVEGHEIRVWAKPHPEDPKRLKAHDVPADVIAALS